MPKKSLPPSQSDLDAFEKAVSDTKPLKINKVRLKAKLKRLPSPKPPPEQDDFKLELMESGDISGVKSEEILSFKQASISNKTLRKLRKGQYNVDAILDLHGMSVDHAKIAIQQFLQQCLQEEARVVLIIHGKGHHSQMPILKTKLNHWLRHLEVVLAFCSATAQHGSRGATYILLKHLTEENLLG